MGLARKHRSKTLVAGPLWVTDSGGQILKKFIHRGQVQGNPPPICTLQSIRLRGTGSADRSLDLARRKIRSKGRCTKSNHAVKHGHLNSATDLRASALDQGPKNTVGRIHATHRVCDSWTQDARWCGCHGLTKVAAQGLRNGVVARSVYIGTGSAKSGDRAIHQARMTFVHSLPTKPKFI